VPRIKFLKDRVVQDENVGTDDETSFKEGQIVTVSDATAAHWINRGVAEEATVQKRATAKTKQEPKQEGDE
jgi:hypothetical protein